MSSTSSTPLVVGVVAAVVIVAAAHVVWPEAVPLVALVPPCLLAATLCPIGQVRVVFALVLAYLLWSTVASGEGVARHLPLLLSLGLMYAIAASRSSHGVAAFAGDRMLGDLRSRLHGMGAIPTLPHGWHAERSFATAHGSAFAGDFNVATTSRCGNTLEMVLADVSGKGQEAGTRALVLAGAHVGLRDQPLAVAAHHHAFLQTVEHVIFGLLGRGPRARRRDQPGADQAEHAQPDPQVAVAARFALGGARRSLPRHGGRVTVRAGRVQRRAR